MKEKSLLERPVDLVRVVEKAIKGYRWQPEWEDIRQEAICQAVVNLRKYPGKANDATLAWRGAQKGAAVYLASRRCADVSRSDHWGKQRLLKIDSVSLSPNGCLYDGEGAETNIPAGVVPDFAPELLERLDVARAYQAMRPEDAALVRRWAEGSRVSELAREAGVPRHQVQARIDRGLARARVALGGAG